MGTPRRVGGGERHLSFRVRQEGTVIRAIAFNMGERAEELMSAGGSCCLVFSPSFNEWQGWRSVQLEVRDFQAGTRARLGYMPQDSVLFPELTLRENLNFAASLFGVPYRRKELIAEMRLADPVEPTEESWSAVRAERDAAQ